MAPTTVKGSENVKRQVQFTSSASSNNEDKSCGTKSLSSAPQNSGFEGLTSGYYGKINVLHTMVLLFISTYKKIEKSILALLFPMTKKLVDYCFDKCGLKVNGNNAFDIQVSPENEREFYIRLANSGPLGLGEMFVEGLWTCKDLDTLLYLIMRKDVYKIYFNFTRINILFNHLLFFVFNLQTKERCWEVGQKHYDKGNELFKSFLDPTMNYSCGYWRRTTNLNQAQLDKMELIARKLKLRPGMKVLDIGCGWGGLCKYLAENYNVEVVGCTISKEQADIARVLCKNLPVSIELVDYRDITEKFDRIVSVGMFEHVGISNYNTFFKVVRNCLTRDGIFLLHTIGVNHPEVPRTEPWFDKYIFPNGHLPCHTDICKYTDGLFVIEDWHNFGNDYAKTLDVWRGNFVKSWPNLKGRYDDVFYKMWYYYLSLSQACFKSRKYQLWQITLSKGLVGGYQSER